MGIMKALLKEKPERGLVMREVEIPEDLGYDEVLIKIKYASVCGTDLHIFQWNEWSQNRIKTPQISGHEFSGEIVKKGDGVKGFEIGDFVSAETHIPCTRCKLCRTGRMHICKDMKILGVDTDGIFAEYAKVPEIVLWKNSRNIPEHFASVQEPLGNAVYTVSSGGVSGKSLLITGAGPIGIMAVQVAKAFGAGPIIVSEVRDYRLNMARDNGADYLVNPMQENALERVKQLTNGEGVDAVLEMSGNEVAFQLGIDSLTPGGHMSILGVYDKSLNININEGILFKNITLYGITGRRMFETWYQLASLLENKRIDLNKVVTHVIDFNDWEKAFELMESGQCGKVVLKVCD